MQNKAKRFSFSLLFCFIIGALTILSFVLSFSGAWFTSSKTANVEDISLKFGSVQLGENFSGEEVINIVPSQEIHYYGTTTSSNISYDGTVDAYYRISFIVTNSAETEDENSIAFSNYLSFNCSQGNQYYPADNKCIYGSVVAKGSIPRGSLIFSKEADNNLINKNLKVKFKIDLIQSQNLDDIPNINSMSETADYVNLFLYYDTL